ncbi:MAG: hypothetical protein OXU25_03085 [Thaumarchaeota archaeon]|nr:hypothetical protein [Nitrososphaerota archaeon]
MDYYGPADQNALPEALGHLYENRDSLLRPGSAYTVLPHGDICAGGPRDGPHVVFRRAEASREIYPPSGETTEAHLPFGFRPVRTNTAQAPPMPFLGTGEPRRGVPTPRTVEPTRPMRPASFGVPREGFDEFGKKTFVDGIVSPIWSYEDKVCMDALSGMDMLQQEFEHGDGATLTGLCGFVDGTLNPNRGSFMRFDTIFIGRDLFVELRLDGVAEASARPAPNIIDHIFMRVLVHRGIPGDRAYAMSNMHGPVFVSGPTEIACTESEFSVTRYCEVISPRPAHPDEHPRGFCVGVKRIA